MNLPKNIQITGQITRGTLNTDTINHFCEHYRCTVRPSMENAYIRNISSIQVGASDQLVVSEEPVYTIQITLGMLEDLTNTVSELVKEENRRKNDKKLMDLYTAYKMMDNLLK